MVSIFHTLPNLINCKNFPLCIPLQPHAYLVLWISDICQYIFYFLFSLFTSRKTQCNTYQNSYSEFILNFLNIIYSKITPFHKWLYLLQLKPLVFLTMPYSVIMIVAMLTCQSACGCVSKHTGVFNHLFPYCFSLKVVDIQIPPRPRGMTCNGHSAKILTSD